MSVTDCYPSPTRQQQTVLTYDPNTGQFAYSTIETWIVIVDDVNTRTIDIPALGAANTLPSPNMPLPSVGQGGFIGLGSTLVIVKRVQPEKSPESPLAFFVQVEYVQPFIYTSGQKTNATLDIDGVATTIPVDVDKSGNAVVNSAGDAYDPKQTIDDFDELVTITYDTDTPPDSDLSAARGLVNSDSLSFTINGITRSYSPRQLKLKNARETTTFGGSVSGGYSGSAIWKVTIELMAKTGSDTFETQLVDQGFYYWASSGSVNTRVKFTGDDGTYGVVQGFLNGAGGKLTVAANTTVTPDLLTFKLEDEYAFLSFLGGI